MTQPNIVFIMADQLAACQIGCYGSGIDSTPTLDGLAARGMRFDKCYATVPVCAPNRANMLTGRSPEVHGIVTNNLVLGAENPTYTQMLQRSGYRTGGFGKFHHTPMQMALPPDFSYLGYDETGITEDPKMGPWLDWIEREHPEHYEEALAVTWPLPSAADYGPDHRNLLPAMEKARAKHLAPLVKDSAFPIVHSSPLPKELHQTTWITDQGMDFMARHLDGDADTPFFCFMSYVDPHDPYDPPAPYDTLFRAEDMPVPIPLQGERHAIQSLENTRDLFNLRNMTPEDCQRLRAMFHGSVRFIDDQIARVVSFLDERGLTDNTIIVFTTDHGEMLGDHGLITKGVKHYDAGIRCPLIVAGPGVEPGVTQRLTDSLDFYPTLCEWAGIAETPPLEGVSFGPTCADSSVGEDREDIFLQSPHNAAECIVQTLVTRDGWRLTVFDEDGAGQMFNLRDDPREERDLYDDPDYTEKRLELHVRLTRASGRRGYTQHYSVLPVKDGRRCAIGEGWQMPEVCDDL